MSKRLKLAYVCPWFSSEYRGPWYNLLNELSKEIDVVCICSKQKFVQYFNRGDNYKDSIETINPHFKVHRFNSKAPKDIMIPFNLGKVLNQENPDVVQSDEFFRLTSICAAKYCKKKGIPFILNSRMRSRPGLIRNLMIRFFKEMAKGTVNQADKIIATQGPCSKEEFLKWFPEKNNIAIITTGLDSNFKNVSKKEIEEFKKKYNLQGKKVVLNVARVYPVKRLDLTIKAFSILKKQVDAVLLIVGPWDKKEKSKLDELIKDLRVRDVIFTGSIQNKDIAPAYASADVYVNTSVTEGICFSFLESMSFKLPIVTFDVGGNKDIVENGKTGFVSQFEDIYSLSRKMIFLLQNDKIRKIMGEEGYKKQKELYDISQIANQLKIIYRGLV